MSGGGDGCVGRRHGGVAGCGRVCRRVGRAGGIRRVILVIMILFIV